MSFEVLVDKNVNFRGVWCAGERVTEKRIKLIFSEYSSKPSRSCRFQLTSSGLHLELHPTADGKKGGKMNEISFQNIRDIVYSQQDLSCLLVIYVDPNSTLSVLACSSEHPEDMMSIHKAFLKERYRRQQDGHANWTLQQRVVVPNGSPLPHNNALGARLLQRSNLTSAAKGSSYRSYSESDAGDENVFLNEEGLLVQRDEIKVDREPIDLNNDGLPEAYHVGIQTIQVDNDVDSASIMSETSMQTLKDDYNALNEEMKALKILLEKTTGISAEEYYRRGDLPQPRNRKSVAFEENSHGHRNPSLPQENGASGAIVDESSTSHGLLAGADDYDRRSISVQTNKSQIALKNRYAKNPVSPSVSNAYKEKVAALKKRGGASGSESGTGLTTDGQSLTPATRPLVVKIPHGKPLLRTMSTGRTTVNRPIEEVYHHRSGSQKRRIVIASPKTIL
uniref:Uncharacterized protein n=1 Tax=Biomphalaria glabrata TaxID=6526 RepID=A0A2C9KMR0_BIOGL